MGIRVPNPPFPKTTPVFAERRAVTSHSRITKLAWNSDWGLIAGTVNGQVLRMGRDLVATQVIEVPDHRSPVGGRAIYGLNTVGDVAVVRNKRGTLGFVDLTSNMCVHSLAAESTCDRSLLMQDEEPSPTIVRGVGISGGKVYYANGFFQFTEVDLGDFSYEIKTPWLNDRRIDDYSLTGPVDVLADREGCLTFADLRARRKLGEVKLDEGNVHKVVWDSRSQCYWVTLDAGFGDTTRLRNGVAKVSETGEVLAQWLGARNDVETIALSNDSSLAAFGGFDNVLSIAATDDKSIVPHRSVSGFTHQITDSVTTPEDTLVVLTQDGELTEVGFDGTLHRRSSYPRSCVWGIYPGREEREVLLATDHGVEAASYDRHRRSLGRPTTVVETGRFVRRLVSVAPAEMYLLLWHSTVVRCDRAGRTMWEADLGKPVYDLVVAGDLIYVSTFSGMEVLDRGSGATSSSLSLGGHPIWTAHVDAAEGLIYAASRTGTVFHVRLVDGEVVATGDIGHYPKRALSLPSGLCFSGGGGVRRYDTSTGAVSRAYVEYLDNTAENGIELGRFFACVSYGMQLGVYELDTARPVALDETLPDFAKAIHSIDDSHFMVGGRGGYLRLYELSDGGPDQVGLEMLWERFTVRQPGRMCLRSQLEQGR